VARCEQQFGSALAWGIAAVGMLPRELRDKLTDRDVDGGNPFMGAITPLPYYLVRTLEIFIIGSLWCNGIGFLPNDHLLPANGTCQDCREQDWAVIIWIVTQSLMICIVPLILVTGPKNSKYALSRPCRRQGEANSSQSPPTTNQPNEVELTTIKAASKDNSTVTATPVARGSPDDIHSVYLGSPTRSVGYSSPLHQQQQQQQYQPQEQQQQYQPQLQRQQHQQYPLQQVPSPPLLPLPQVRPGGPMMTPTVSRGLPGGPVLQTSTAGGGTQTHPGASTPASLPQQSFRPLSVESLAAQRMAGDRNAAYGAPSPRPRVRALANGGGRGRRARRNARF
jgi:hypothetical protein